MEPGVSDAPSTDTLDSMGWSRPTYGRKPSASVAKRARPSGKAIPGEVGPNRLRLCLAAGGGGHIRQMLDLEPVWGQHDHFFVSEGSGLSASIAKRHRTYFVAPVALGQAKLGRPDKLIFGAVRSFFESGRIMLRERPDVFITTGPGSTFFPLLWARLFGAKVVLIESLARFHSLSAFAKASAPLAHHKVVQSPALTSYWPDAPVFDPIKVLDKAERPSKEPLIFATVGTVLPFDRLVNMVAELKQRGDITERVVIQSGAGGARPAGAECFEALSFEQVQATLRLADVVICHGGTGSLITALRQGCRVVAVPRRRELGEHYDNHQEEITRAFEARGLIAVAHSTEELAQALKAVRERPAPMATSDTSELIAHLDDVISSWAARRSVRTRSAG